MFTFRHFQMKIMLVFALIGLVAVLSLMAGNPSSEPPFPPPEARCIPGEKDPPEVITLLQQRRDTVRIEFDQARKYPNDFRSHPEIWTAIAERLLIAESDAARTPAERVAAYREHRDNLKLLEEQFQRVPEVFKGQGVLAYAQRLWVRNQRLQAEVWLLRAEQAKTAATAVEADSPEVRKALIAWRDGVRQWAKLWLESRVVISAATLHEIVGTMLDADLTVAEGPADQLLAQQAYRDRLLAAEKDMKGEVERKRYDPIDYLRIKAMRCEADVMLGRLKAGGAGKPSYKDSPEVRAALDDWIQAIQLEMEIDRKHYEPGKVTPAEFIATDESLLHAELAAATKQDERVAAYKKFLAKLKEVEAIQKTRSENKQVGKEDYARAIFNRAAVELTLLQLTSAADAKTSQQMQALRKEQREALRSEVQAKLAAIADNRTDFQSLQESAGQLLLMELELAKTPAERIAAYEANAKILKTAEDQYKALKEANNKNMEVYLLWAHSARLEAEIWLLRAKRALSR